jgi:protein O-GlcNAcase/histone acetyltransferase
VVFRGVVEGFYGKPWSSGCRDSMVSMLAALDGPAYLYAPKNDPFHRLQWRETYPDFAWDELASTMRLSADSGVAFHFGISPWAFASGDAVPLRAKAMRALDSGASGLAVLFDDIPDLADAELARRQLDLAFGALGDMRVPVMLCPSVYCIELMESLDGQSYLDAWRESVPQGWRSIWTGDQVVSRELSAASVERAAALLGSEPVLWDNLLADDYCLRRIYLAGLEGRNHAGAGYLVNPSEIEPVALHAVFRLLQAEGASPAWPETLGNRQAWALLSRFHHMPWTDATAGELLVELRSSMQYGPSDELLERLSAMQSLLSDFIESLYAVEGGFGLMPYAVDVRKFLYWWGTALEKGSAAERLAELDRLAMRRLPYEHPLAAGTLETLLRTNPEEGRGR